MVDRGRSLLRSAVLRGDHARESKENFGKALRVFSSVTVASSSTDKPRMDASTSITWLKERSEKKKKKKKKKENEREMARLVSATDT